MEVIVYSKTVCPYCVQAKQYLKNKGIPFVEKNLDNDDERKAFYESVGDGVRTVPQIFVDSVRIGGFQDLIKSDVAARFAAGKFDEDF